MSTTTIEGIEVQIAENNEYPRVLWQGNNNTIIPLAANEVNSVNNNDIGIYVKQSGKYYFVPKYVVPVTKSLYYYAKNNIENYRTVTAIPQVNIDDLTNEIVSSDASFAFHSCEKLLSIPQEIVNTINSSRIRDMAFMFAYCNDLQSIQLLDMSNAISTQDMFRECSSLTSVPAFNLSSVTNTAGMFAGCSSLINIPNLDISNSYFCSEMFFNCSALTSNAGIFTNFDISSCNEMNRMFSGCSSLTVVPQLNCEYVTSADSLFESCINLTTVPYFNTENLKTMKLMFANCTSLPSKFPWTINLNGVLLSIEEENPGITQTDTISQELLTLLVDKLGGIFDWSSVLEVDIACDGTFRSFIFNGENYNTIKQLIGGNHENGEFVINIVS